MSEGGGEEKKGPSLGEAPSGGVVVVHKPAPLQELSSGSGSSLELGSSGDCLELVSAEWSGCGHGTRGR